MFRFRDGERHAMKGAQKEITMKNEVFDSGLRGRVLKQGGRKELTELNPKAFGGGAVGGSAVAKKKK